MTEFLEVDAVLLNLNFEAVQHPLSLLCTRLVGHGATLSCVLMMAGSPFGFSIADRAARSL